MTEAQVYASIPSFVCKDGCTDCCGPVPFTKTEWARLTPEEQAKPLVTYHCQFVGPSGCTIYDRRPLLCRMFGAVQDPKMTCPHGCGPTLKLLQIQGCTMMRHYQKQGFAQDPLRDLGWAQEILSRLP